MRKSSALFPIIYVLTRTDDGDKRKKAIERVNTAEKEDKEISKLTIMSDDFCEKRRLK